MRIPIWHEWPQFFRGVEKVLGNAFGEAGDARGVMVAHEAPQIIASPLQCEGRRMGRRPSGGVPPPAKEGRAK